MNLAPDSWPCAICDRPATYRVHPGCQQRLADNLNALPGLYRDLEQVLPAGRGHGDGPVSGSRHAPLPVRLDVLDLRARGGIEGILTTWERDVRGLLGWCPPPFRGSIEQTVDGSARFLHDQVPWLCDQHPAVRELAQEIAATVGHARSAVTGERRERPLRVVCATDGCGGILRITLNCDGRRCPRCQTSYSHEQLLDLDLAGRSVAA